MKPGRIIRPAVFERLTDPDEARPARVLKNASADAPGDEEPRLPRILRGAEARVASEPFEVSVERLEPDFPLPAPASPDEPPKAAVDPEQIREEVEEEWKRKLEEAVAHTWKEGYDEGYEAARRELLEHVDATRRELNEDSRRMAESIDGFLTDLEPTLVSLAIDAAEAVIGSPLTDGARAETERALAAALETLAGDGHIDVALHPVDLLRLQESGLDQQFAGAISGIRWHPDDSLAEGDWSARSSESVIRRIRKEMIGSIRSELGIDVEPEAAP